MAAARNAGLKEETEMKALRTPDERFANLPGYPFEPNYSEVFDGDGGKLRIHHVDEGPKDGEVVLCMHGQPTWSFLYRKMIPIFAEAGYRTVAPDLVGFGKSDKPTEITDYTYSAHVSWISQWLQGLDLKNITLVCQDWGGLIGLRVVTANPDRFSRIVVANTGLPDGSQAPLEMAQMMRQAYASLPVPEMAEVGHQFQNPGPVPAFLYWRKYCAENPNFAVKDVMSTSGLSPDLMGEVLDAYEAPFPDGSYLSGARRFPSLVPIMPDDPEVTNNQTAWSFFRTWQKPLLTAFSDGDPVTAGGEKFFQNRVPGAKGQQHVTITGAGHFLQEDAGERFAEEVIKFIRET